MPPANREPVRFLSRFDKSATNIKESELFCAIGQVCCRRFLMREQLIIICC